MSGPTRVFLVDDDPLVRAGLRFLFDSASDLLVIGEAAGGVEAVEAVRSRAVDVVLMDLRMPGRVDGIAATHAIRALSDPPHVIALTTWDVDDAVLRALDAGASGFLLKSAPPADILQAVRAVMAGDAVLSPRSTRHVLDHLRHNQAADHHRAALQAMAALTARERDVCIAVGRGWSNSQIAGQLYIAEATVKAHLSAIQTKLGVRNRMEIAVLAERAGLLHP